MTIQQQVHQLAASTGLALDFAHDQTGYQLEVFGECGGVKKLSIRMKAGQFSVMLSGIGNILQIMKSEPSALSLDYSQYPTWHPRYEAKQGQSIRHREGTGDRRIMRITFDPEGYRDKPFIAFRSGSAVNRFAKLAHAKNALATDANWTAWK